MMGNNMYNRYFCKKEQRDMSWEERQNHQCFTVKKGRRKGKMCGSMQVIPVYN